MTSKSFGYGRISTTDQNSASQRDALLSACVDEIFIDTFTGTASSRPELDRLRLLLRRGDSLVITRLDRLGRSAKDLLNLVSDLEVGGINLHVLEQNINTSTPDGKLFFTLVAAFAEFEREIMRARTIDGLAAARARGKIGGRKPALTSVKSKLVAEMYVKGTSVTDIAEMLGVSRPTVYRALKSS